MEKGTKEYITNMKVKMKMKILSISIGMIMWIAMIVMNGNIYSSGEEELDRMATSHNFCKKRSKKILKIELNKHNTKKIKM